MTTQTIDKGQDVTKRVFVLGAGASYGAGFPLAAQLFSRAYDRMNDDDQRQLEKTLGYLYPVSGRKSQSRRKLANVNVEEFLSLLNTAEEFNEILPTTYLEPVVIRRLRTSLLKNIVELLAESQLKAESSEKLVGYVDRFLSKLEPRDTVITFNWDLLVERRMCQLGQAFKLCPREESNHVALLKVHGSIDWYRGAELDSRKGFEVVYRQLYKAPWTEVSRQSDKLLGDALPFIVPPTFNKSFRGCADIEEIWVQAFQRLQEADEIYVCGYRFPPEDLYARFVLRRAIRFNVIRRQRKKSSPGLKLTVIDPDPSVAKFAQQNIYARVRFDEEKFENSILSR